MKDNRYIRNIILPEIALDGQIKLANSRILIIGAGGLGSAILYYLVCAGIADSDYGQDGEIMLIDDDVVEISNLQRQILHNQFDIGESKISSAVNKIKLLNSKINIKALKTRIDEHQLQEIGLNYSIIIDASDNFSTRFIINKFCFEAKKTLIFGAVRAFSGQLATFKSFIGSNPCYCCFNTTLDRNNADLVISEKGILGAVAGNLGTHQAISAVKEILQIGDLSYSKMMICDFLSNRFYSVKINKNPACKICS